MLQKLLFCFLSICVLSAGAQTQNEPIARTVPCVLENGRFFVKAKGPGNDSLVFVTDTGGSLLIFDDVLTRHQIVPQEREMEGQKMQVVGFSGLTKDRYFPVPNVNGEQIVFVAPRFDFGFPMDGMLGQQWFGGHIWEFNYLTRQLRVGGELKIKAGDPHAVTLGFVESGGKRQINFPRIQIIVDGETLDMLFDTGATIELTDTAKMQLKETIATTRATSFISASIMDKWRKNHPEWRVIHNADKHLQRNGIAPDMIEVPSIEIGGYKTGPVWFTGRPDKNFTEFMSQWTDKQVVGAVGGSAFRYFKITVDYPNAIARFEQ